ncbi:hypothetical protein IB286_14420 [Spongiibacter sp. KMU-158]|uniref:Uncharacterized protein n=1 Tax=Spongiibacter pelagi TaxID=2760804 RepID=A0A927GXI1_9GAMM|nr:hypothetical protein [Spongiibacter pelagi]MBD2860193.1 hypothetical protein [Spongiibacter pelagi]
MQNSLHQHINYKFKHLQNSKSYQGCINNECWKANGRDTHLIVQGQGHILAPIQDPGQLILYGFDDTLYCGGTAMDTQALIMDFLESKLLQRPAQYTLPEVCFSRSATETGNSLSSVPSGGSSYFVPPTTVYPGGLNSVITLLSSLPLDTVLSSLQSLPVEGITTLTQVLSGLADPASLGDYADDIVHLLPNELLQQLSAPPQFIPLTSVEQHTVLAGIPRIQMNITGGNGDANTLYIGLGRIPAEGGDPELINEQVLPVTGIGSKLLEMIGVSAELNAGDSLGLIVYGFHPYFLHVASLAQPPLPAEITANVQVPEL